jgi:glycosyltransferase involved in cell wall biosynthesis
MSKFIKNKRLSLLIPAYNYSKGVGRILDSLCSTSYNDIEILVADDSENNCVKDFIEMFYSDCPNELSYKKNCSRVGAVANWNSLIKSARGEFVVLMHHDEFPINANFISKLLAILEEKNDNIDVLVMNCLLINSDETRVRYHVPYHIKRLVIRFFPEYMLKRNVIGPTSCLVVRRKLYPLFDEKLKWFVDVDMYFRLRKSTSRWCMCDDLDIGSAYKRRESITASIKSDITIIRTKEREVLIKKFPYATIWIDHKNNKFLYFSENIVWIIMRIFTRLIYRFKTVASR